MHDTNQSPPPVPDGFAPIRFGGRFNDHIATVYRRGEGVDAVHGFHAEDRHENPNGIMHGGMLMAFVDTIMGELAQLVAQRATATISLNVDFVAGMPLRGWVEGRARVVRLTNSLAFMAGEATHDGKILISASGIWRVFNRPVEPGKGSSV